MDCWQWPSKGPSLLCDCRGFPVRSDSLILSSARPQLYCIPASHTAAMGMLLMCKCTLKTTQQQHKEKESNAHLIKTSIPVIRNFGQGDSFQSPLSGLMWVDKVHQFEPLPVHMIASVCQTVLLLMSQNRPNTKMKRSRKTSTEHSHLCLITAGSLAKFSRRLWRKGPHLQHLISRCFYPSFRKQFVISLMICYV